ncbi:DUF1801 domain-containing protein [Pedobacter sp. Leaf250]|uniref:DUF1801 domain-containing protein n=1 Tax=Pedobacter sp. Leaf250 TaxID=2876559 RepID=UPI001E53804B|nr:DUF1801 domain-containing protein [Pedobacter sp. Leaf250]
MLNPLDNFFEQKDEPIKGCLQYLRLLLIGYEDITEHWKYGLPFYYYKGKMFCYIWIHKKYRQPYIGLVDGNKIDHEDLLREKRARMKILLINHLEDIPEKKIKSILRQALYLRS